VEIVLLKLRNAICTSYVHNWT